MRGPRIFVRSIQALRIEDKHGNRWQYHPRSDRHSKIACWSIIFDFLRHCPLLRKHAEEGKIGFGINHKIIDYRHDREKNLDLVLCRPNPRGGAESLTFAQLAERFEVTLTVEEGSELASLPILSRTGVGSVLVALEAKACMTEHAKARPRLYDELMSSHSTIHGDRNDAIAAGFVAVNLSATFFSPTNLYAGKPRAKSAKQPASTINVVKKLKQLPRRSSPSDQGFDALGICILEFKNDGSDVRLVEDIPQDLFDEIGPALTYRAMIDRLSVMYGQRYAAL